jgi:hypothetical protein
MKRAALWAACVIILVGVGGLSLGQGYAQDTDDTGTARCSLATLRGMYLFAYDGVAIEGQDQVPFAAAGYEVYHGNGKVNGIFSVSENGEITRNARASGRYTVKADCTGTVTYPDLQEHFDLFIAPDGSMFTFIATDPGVVAAGFELQGTAKRVGD